MSDALPPPLTDDGVTEPGWYPDPHSADLLRWWDGEEWSETDVKLPGDDGYPWWHPEFLRERVRMAIEDCVVWIAARVWRG